MRGSKLILRDIHHVYGKNEQTGTEAIRHIDLEVKDGEFLAIVGASGCGKSTLLNIMCGMIEPTEGEVLIDGEPVSTGKHRIAIFLRQIHYCHGEKSSQMWH